MRIGLVSFVLFSFLGCGSGDPCASVDPPCGGDLVGTWELSDSCFDSTCTGFEISDKPDNKSTFTFRADGMVELVVSINGHVAYKEPATCIKAPAMSCADLNSSDAKLSISCTGDTVCDCNGTYAFNSMPVTLPYATAGNNVTIGSGATAGSRGYCVKGDRMTMHGGNASEGIAVTIFRRR